MIPHEQISILGRESDNPWIRRSSEIPGWLFCGEHEFLWELATRGGEGDVIEIGSWLGKSACILAGACLEHAPLTRLVCVDPFAADSAVEQKICPAPIPAGERSTFHLFLDNAIRLGFSDSIVPMAAFSWQAIPLLRPGSFRMAFVDGTHDYENVKRDCELCLPLLRSGGVLAIHDVIRPLYIKRLANGAVQSKASLCWNTPIPRGAWMRPAEVGEEFVRVPRTLESVR